jgi:hypothetical protein
MYTGARWIVSTPPSSRALRARRRGLSMYRGCIAADGDVDLPRLDRVRRD